MSAIYVIVKEITSYNEAFEYQYDQQANICAYATLEEARAKLASMAEQHQIHHSDTYSIASRGTDCFVFERKDGRKDRSYFIDAVAFGVQS